MQRTAFGAADVPEVKSNAHRASTAGSGDAPARGLPLQRRVPRLVERSDKHLPRGGRIVAVREAIRDEDAPGKIEALDRRIELLLVAWFRDHELHVRMRDVACEMLPVPGVVQPCDGDACQPGTAQRKDIVGRVVEEDADVGGTAGLEARGKQPRIPHRFVEQLGVGPDEVPEAKGRTIGVALVGAVAPQQGRGVRSRQRHLGQRWGEGGGSCAGHGGSIPSGRSASSR